MRLGDEEISSTLTEEEKIATLSMAKRSLIDYCILMQGNYVPNWHHEVIAKKLEEVEEGTCRRLMLFMPPRHGKSELATKKFPAWYLGRNPAREIMCCSYSSDLAEEFGRATRDIVDDRLHQAVFPDSFLRKGSKSATRWRVGAGRGGFLATGVGGSITGMGANVLIIDDPVKNREEANSDTYRRKVWDWYTSTAFTRLEKDGAVILIMCMTGDTPVLMADGSEKPLRDIKEGDTIATYENGGLSTSTVRRWKNQGLDLVYEIKMKSGTVVKANERHPFLVENNQRLGWVRLKNLKKGDKIVKASIQESIKESNVSMRGVLKKPDVKDTATHTTIKVDGPADTGHLLLIQGQGELPDLSTGTESILLTTNGFTMNREGNAQFVDSRQEKALEPIGETSSASTTTTKQGKYVDSSAMTATSQLDTEKQKKSCSKLLSTYGITLDEIADIREVGEEEVFDIQVDRTENFIANGLVSHNTRWHDDDLAGRLLERDGEKGFWRDPETGLWKQGSSDIGEQGKWEVVRFPALATEKEKFRRKDTALWRDKYDEKALKEIKATIGVMDFSALYQQNPIDAEAQLFQDDWFQYWKVIPNNVKYFTSVDPAISKKKGADESVVLTLCRDAHDKIYVVDVSHGKWDPSELIDEIFRHQEKYNSRVGVEAQQYQYALIHYMKREQQMRGKYINVIPVRQTTNKEVRIKGLEPFYRNGLIFHPPGGSDALEEQLKRFPSGKHDDIIDALVTAVYLSTKPVVMQKGGTRAVGMKWGRDGLPIIKS
jgi:predicted phage terminase large subunit-like protein